MTVRWTSDAADDFVCIVDRIREQNPDAARRVARTIYKEIEGLRKFPKKGRVGLVGGTRELVFPRWPYVVVYEIAGEQVQVLRLRHASRDWP